MQKLKNFHDFRAFRCIYSAGCRAARRADYLRVREELFLTLAVKSQTNIQPFRGKEQDVLQKIIDSTRILSHHED